MIERPLVLFAQPALADKEKKYGGSSGFNRPAYDRQKVLLSPKFKRLQDALENGHVTMTSSSNSIEPEYTLVFETVGDPNGFYNSVKQLKSQYPNIEWIMELSSTCPNDDDFYIINKKGERDDNKQLSTKIFCILTNQQALQQILSLWNNYKNNEHFQFERGLAGFKNLFLTLKDVHQWGIHERIEDTGLLEDWAEQLQTNKNNLIKAQIELFYRSSEKKRILSEERVVNLVTSNGGKILKKSIIDEIQYHALLVEIPTSYAKNIIDNKEVELTLANEIMFIKGSGQVKSVGLNEKSKECVNISQPKRIFSDPIVAMFDGMPQENHPLLKDLLIVDDPDSFSSMCPVNERFHGTSMASLILRGKNMGCIKDDVHKIYVRPIMKSEKNFDNKTEEFIPDDFLIVDKLYECVRRLFERSAGMVAPTVRIINLSIGIAYREYYNLISPLARLLDWLSFKYRVLFIVSAGNHSDNLNLGMSFSDYAKMDIDKKNQFIFQYIFKNIRNLRLLSPAESMNSLTIGSVFSDNNDIDPITSVTNVCSSGMPAIYSSYGRGINNSIKPDILYDGGRCFIRENIYQKYSAKWVISNTQRPGIQSAYPIHYRNGDWVTGYTFGTSNSAALISNQACECYEILNELFVSVKGENIPYDYASVMIKAMLVHGASWANLKKLCKDSLILSGRQEKNFIHDILGYGVANVDKVKECTKNQITLVGYGDIKQNQAYEYSIPLPFDFYKKKYKRKLIVTLAYFSPIHPSLIKYRDKQVWFTINNGKNIVGTRAEYDNNAVQRGTIQHEIFESDSIVIWKEEFLTIKVNCRDYASEKDADVLIPYALFVTFEMSPEYNIDVYQTILNKIRMPNIINTKVD